MFQLLGLVGVGTATSAIPYDSVLTLDQSLTRWARGARAILLEYIGSLQAYVYDASAFSEGIICMVLGEESWRMVRSYAHKAS